MAAVCGLAAAPAPAAVRADSAGIYSEELERANSINPVAAGHAQRGAGVGLVRQPFAWSRIETAEGGALDYSVYDQVMAVAAIAGLAVLPVLVDPPPWRDTAPLVDRAPGMYPPRDPDAMAVLAGLLVQRYGPDGHFWAAHPQLAPAPIRSWQVWNEPNLPVFWASGPDPAAYARLLRAVGSAIHAVDPAAEVVAAGLPHGDGAMPMARFIDGMYAAGARGAFDTLAIHPYAADPADVLGILRAARDELDRLGDQQRPIWATEFGWATDGPPATVSASEQAQSQMLGDTIDLMKREREALLLRGFVVFRWRDVALNPGQQDSWPLHTGLVRRDGSPKPAFASFGDAVAGWFADPDAAPAAPMLAPDAGSPPDAGASPAGASPAAVAGVRRRVLRIDRHVRGRRLFVRVTVPLGGGRARVRISYAAVRRGRTVVTRTRWSRASRRTARAVFALPRSARSADLLRVSARHGDAVATRDLRLRPRRAVSAPSAG